LNSKPSRLQEVLQNLAQRGFYVSVGDEEIEINEDILCQSNPFSEAAHVALIDTLMSAYIAQVVSIQHVVQTVKSYGSFNASRELPFDLEDALLLWVNKVCHYALKQLTDEPRKMDGKISDARQRRRLRAKVGQTQLPFMDDLVKDLSDGRSLGVLTSFYLPDALSMQGLKLSDELTEEDMKQNVLLAKGALEETFKSSHFAFPLSVDDIIESSLILKQNIVTLIAQFFDWFETQQSKKLLKGETKSQTDNQVTEAISKHESLRAQQESQQSQQTVAVTRDCQDLARKPPLSSTANSPVAKYKRKTRGQDSPTETLSEFQVDQPRLHNSMHHHISTSQPSSEPEQQNGHPAYWKHVPLKRGRWMSRSLDSFQRGLMVTAELKVSDDVSIDHRQPELLVTTWREQHDVLSVPSVVLDETFSCNEQTDMEHENINLKSKTECLVGSDDAGLVNNTMEVSTEDVEDIPLQTMSNIVFEKSQHANGSYKTDGDIDVDYSDKAQESREITHLCKTSSPAGTYELETKQQPKQTCTQAETSPKSTGGVLPSQIATTQTEDGCHVAKDSFPKLPPELLMLRINLDEKRRRIEQEQNELEAQWKEHRKQVAETAFLEALHRSKSKSLASSKKSSPLLSDTTNTEYRNKWLDWGGGVGTKQTEKQIANHKSHYEETDETKFSILAGEDRVTAQQDSESSHTSVIVADQLINRQDRPTKQATASSLFFPDEFSLAIPEHVDNGPAIKTSKVSCTSTVMQVSDTLLPVQSTQSTNETLDIGKPVGFFIGGWGNGESKISIAELERRKMKLLQARQKQLADEKVRRQIAIEKRKEQARRKKIEEERLHEEREQEEAKLRAEQQARELAEAEVRRSEEDRRLTHITTVSRGKERPGKHGSIDSYPNQQSKMRTTSEQNGQIGSKERFAVAFAETAPSQPKLATRSNRQLIQNAVSHFCLAGDVNRQLKEQVLQVLEQSEAVHFVILFRDVSGKKFRALYSCESDIGQLLKLYGRGPRHATSQMISELFKYNSGSKSFQLIQSKTLSLSVDAFTIASHFWQTSRHKSVKKL
jgi:hypothetical protein